MTSRAAVQTLLETDAHLQALGFGTVYGSNAADDVSESRFLIVTWQGTQAAFGSRGTDSVLVWAHDRDRDYAAIDAALSRVRAILTEAVHVAGSDGRILTVARWNGCSEDAYDDGYRTVTKNAEFSLLSR